MNTPDSATPDETPEIRALAKAIVEAGSRDPITPERVTLTEAERGWLTGWFETYLTHDRFAKASDDDLAELLAPTVERILSDRLRAGQADAWDEAAQALAWCLNNGPADSAAAYVAEHNPYRD